MNDKGLQIAILFRYGTGRAADTAGLNLGAVGVATNKRDGKIPAGENEEVTGGDGLEGKLAFRQRKIVFGVLLLCVTLIPH